MGNPTTLSFEWQQEEESYSTFVEAMYELISSPALLGNYEIRWYTEKDPQGLGYSIKGHTKMYCFDRQVAIIGGSNLIPTPGTMNNDCDVVVMGPVAAELSDVFQKRWQSLQPVIPESECGPASEDIVELAITSPVVDVIDIGDWDDDNVYPYVLASSPNSLGIDDPIFHVCLQMLREAKHDYRMCMGWSCLSAPFIAECIAATNRGVRVQLILNSKFSADLCVPQRDLILSVTALYKHTRDVEIYLTHPPLTHTVDCTCTHTITHATHDFDLSNRSRNTSLSSNG